MQFSSVTAPVSLPSANEGERDRASRQTPCSVFRGSSDFLAFATRENVPGDDSLTATLPCAPPPPLAFTASESRVRTCRMREQMGCHEVARQTRREIGGQTEARRTARLTSPLCGRPLVWRGDVPGTTRERGTSPRYGQSSTTSGTSPPKASSPRTSRRCSRTLRPSGTCATSWPNATSTNVSRWCGGRVARLQFLRALPSPLVAALLWSLRHSSGVGARVSAATFTSRPDP